MEIETKNISVLSRNPAEVVALCKNDHVVTLTKYGRAELVIASVDFFNELVEMANKAKMYKDLWQAEVNGRQGNMLSAREAIDQLEGMREARGSYDDRKNNTRPAAAL